MNDNFNPFYSTGNEPEPNNIEAPTRDVNPEETTRSMYQTSEVISEPYRFRYQNGEKSEDTRYQHYYYGTSGNNSENNTSHESNNYYSSSNSASGTSSKKKRPLLKMLKWVAGAACLGIIAGAAFLGTSYLASDFLGIQIVQKNSDTSKGLFNCPQGNCEPGTTGFPVFCRYRAFL